MTSFVTTNQSTHSDTDQARSVSNMSWVERNGGISSGYSRERHLLLTAPPQIAVQAGGTPVGADATPRQAFRAAGADFSVIERPLGFNDDPENIAESDWRRIPSHKAIVREDTRYPLGVVGRGYHPVQNEALIQLFEFLREDATLQNIVVLSGGRKVFATANVNIEGEVIPGQPIFRHIHCFNSFDGSTGFGAYFSDMALVCSNQLAFIKGRGARQAKAAGRGLVLRHTSQVQSFVKKLPALIDLQNRSFKQSLEQLKPLTTRRLTTSAAEAILTATYADKLAVPVKVKGEPDRQRTLVDLEKTDLQQIRSHFGGSTGLGIDPSDRSIWNIFMAVTQHETHDTGRAKNDIERARVRLESLWGGPAAQRIDRCKAACLAVAAA